MDDSLSLGSGLTYLGLLDATAIAGFENMFALDPEDALVALVFCPSTMFQLRE
jgi:hypothetical protein